MDLVLLNRSHKLEFTLLFIGDFKVLCNLKRANCSYVLSVITISLNIKQLIHNGDQFNRKCIFIF